MFADSYSVNYGKMPFCCYKQKVPQRGTLLGQSNQLICAQ